MGFHVIGCEVVKQACDDFFSENSITDFEITDLDQGKDIIEEQELLLRFLDE